MGAIPAQRRREYIRLQRSREESRIVNAAAPNLIETYRIDNASDLLTPALAIYPEIVDRNIAATIRLLGGDANRWRPHVKTAKLGFMMRRIVESGVVQSKVSTTVELAAACASGMKDVLL